MSPKNKPRSPTNPLLPRWPLYTPSQSLPVLPGEDTFTGPSARRAGAPAARPSGLPDLPLPSSPAPLPQARSTGAGVGGPRSQAPGWKECAAAPRRHTHRPPPSASPPRPPGSWKPLGLALACGAPTPPSPLLGWRPAAAARAPETCSNRCSPTSCSAHAAWSRCPLPASAATSPPALRPGFPDAHVTRAVPRGMLGVVV